MLWKTHPLAFASAAVAVALVATFTFGILNGWSNGALGSAEMIIFALGAVLYGFIFDPEGKYRRRS